MREERNNIAGPLVISDAVDFWGAVSGHVHVVHGAKVYLRGAVYGDLTVTHGGRIHIYGQVSGTVTVKEGAKCIISGMVGGDVINTGGRLYIDSTARVLGKLKRKDGETSVEPRAQVRE